MTSDLQALLAAVVADPSDDVARLVYADCLEEHGDAPRAQFIRLQIEAERHHPDSNARAKLESQARALFAEHWVEWWGEVCAAINFPLPVSKPATILGRLVRRLARRPEEYGAPYARDGYCVDRIPGASDPQPFGGFSGVWFRCGFPEDVSISGQSSFLTGWPRASPLRTLIFFTTYPNWWSDGPHLASVRAVNLVGSDPDALTRVLGSPHLGNLELLSLPVPAPETHANDLVLLGDSPRARQLKVLGACVWDDRAASTLANAASLAGLESLTVPLAPHGEADPDGAGRRLAALARSPRLAGLKELAVEGGLDPDGIAAALRRPTWGGLRTLELNLAFDYNRLTPLAEPDGLPELEDFRLGGIWINQAEVDVLVRSPLLKRLRHFALVGSANYRPVLAQLAGALDLGRIETFSLNLPGVDSSGPDGTEPLRKHFGQKLKLVTR